MLAAAFVHELSLSAPTLQCTCIMGIGICAGPAHCCACPHARIHTLARTHANTNTHTLTHARTHARTHEPHLGNGSCERGLAVIHMPDGADIKVGLGACIHIIGLAEASDCVAGVAGWCSASAPWMNE